jgi:uncharacterized protein YicC (UPF0701 family)
MQTLNIPNASEARQKSQNRAKEMADELVKLVTSWINDEVLSEIEFAINRGKYGVNISFPEKESYHDDAIIYSELTEQLTKLGYKVKKSYIGEEESIYISWN